MGIVGQTTGTPRPLTHDEIRAPALSSLETAAFHAFHDGLLILDSDGRVLCRNRAATRLIEAIGLSEAELTCCALLGCRRPGTVLATACVTKLALGRETPPPEIRVDIATDSGPTAMWVAVAALGPVVGEGERVALQLRPGAASNHRQRTDPDWMTGPRLRIRVLGRTVVESTEGPIGGAWLEQRSGQLLKYLVASRRRPVAIDEIGESVWPDADYAIAAGVRYYIHTLRRKLEPERAAREPSQFIAVGSGAYCLKLDNVEVDADEFERLVGSGLARIDADPERAAAELERGLSIYGGDFLADLPYADWAMDERHRLHDLACLALRRLADTHVQRELIDDATRCLERLATLQPYDEDVHRRLMELDIAQGHRSDAVRRYASLRCRLRQTFGHDPDFTPADLARPQL
jgi:DNA-binding SARP family transcriptional activator